MKMKKVVALMLAAGCMLSAVSCGSGKPAEEEAGGEYAVYLVSKADYPEMAPYPDESAFYKDGETSFDDKAYSEAYDAWSADKRRQRNWFDGDTRGLDTFFANSIGEFLSRSGGENKVYSPLNVYMALAMLAELTDGNSRQEILDLLGAEDIDVLRTQAAALWNANYSNDGATTSILANSLWMNEDIGFVQETMDTLAEEYYASSYRGEMGSEEFNKALQNWLNEQTGGLLEDQISNIEMNPETVLALASTVYYRAKWADEFRKEATREGRFSVLDTDGATVTCDFMHQSGSRNYYWGEKFSAVSQSFENGGDMWLILPDGDVSVDELLSDGETLDFLLSNGDWENRKFLTVNLALPEFDVTSQMDLVPGLKALGVEDVFDFETSDFTPMTTEVEEIALTKAQHGARVVIDEEGCEAAAYTVMLYCGSAMPPREEVDFVLDRPFLFCITGEAGVPLFVGVVNRPV